MPVSMTPGARLQMRSVAVVVQRDGARMLVERGLGGAIHAPARIGVAAGAARDVHDAAFGLRRACGGDRACQHQRRRHVQGDGARDRAPDPGCASGPTGCTVPALLISSTVSQPASQAPRSPRASQAPSAALSARSSSTCASACGKRAAKLRRRAARQAEHGNAARQQVGRDRRAEPFRVSRQDGLDHGGFSAQVSDLRSLPPHCPPKRRKPRLRVAFRA